MSSVLFSMFGLFNNDNRGISEFNPSVFSVPRLASILRAPEQNYTVEYLHRLFVGFTAATIYAIAILAHLRIKKLQRLATLAAIVISVQIAIGALVVINRLDLRLVTIHLPIGVALFGIILIMFCLFMRCHPRMKNNNLEI